MRRVKRRYAVSVIVIVAVACAIATWLLLSSGNNKGADYAEVEGALPNESGEVQEIAPVEATEEDVNRISSQHLRPFRRKHRKHGGQDVDDAKHRLSQIPE